MASGATVMLHVTWSCQLRRSRAASTRPCRDRGVSRTLLTCVACYLLLSTRIDTPAGPVRAIVRRGTYTVRSKRFIVPGHGVGLQSRRARESDAGRRPS